MAFTITRAIEQWSLSADTSTTLFSSSVVTVPFATRNTAFADLSNSMSSGVLTLSSAVKADYTACKCTVFCFPIEATISGGVDYTNMILYADTSTKVLAFEEHTGLSHLALNMETEWFDHTALTDLEIGISADDAAFGLDAIYATTDAFPATIWELEFR